MEIGDKIMRIENAEVKKMCRKWIEEGEIEKSKEGGEKN